MVHGLYAVRDAAADAFLPVFQIATDSMAIREFSQLAENPDHMFCKHRKDFSLYKVGSFDDLAGSVHRLEEPRFLFSADGVPGAMTGNIAPLIRERSN